MGESDDLANTYSYILDLVLACVCAVLFVILLSLDVWKAFKKRAYWFPGQALVLSAPTIQFLSFVDKLNSREHPEADLLFVNTTRVMICVIIGYLLPGMVNYSFTTMGSNIGALALTVIIHMVSEVYFFMEKNERESDFVSRSSVVLNSVSSSPSPSPSPSPSSVPAYDFEYHSHFWFVELNYYKWRIISWANLFTVIILLVSLLTCAVLAGKSIRNIISWNVPKALSSCCKSVGQDKQLQCTHSTGDHVLKCWIVVRASQPEDIVSRSVFSSFVGLVVTYCIVFLAVDWIQIAPTKGVDVYELTPPVFQFVFISVGWIIILFRWLTGVMYFSRDLRSLFKWEDFWTRNIVELKANLNAHYRERLFRQKRLPKTAIQESGIVSSIMAIRLYSLILTMALCLQKLMVSLSKVCWCLSEIIFRMVRRILLSPEKNKLLSGSDIKTDDSPFFKHKEALEAIKMPGEFAYSLWFANESAFKKVEKHMEEGSEKGSKYSSQLIKLKEHRTGDPPHDDAVVSVEEVENFQEVGKMSWKMKAVSLIRFMIFYYEDAVSTDIDDAMQAYCQAWLLLDIVDASNPEAKLASLAADKEFDALEDIWKKHLKMKSTENPKYSHSFKEHPSKLLEGKIEKRELCQHCEGDFQLFSEEEEAKATEDENYKESLHQNKEWMKNSAAKLSVYKTRKALDLDTDHSMDKLKRLLANVIFSCIEVEFDRAVIKICNKWAREGNESAIFNAAFVAGIAQGLKIVEGGGGVHLNVDAAVHVPEGSQVSKYPDAINQV